MDITDYNEVKQFIENLYYHCFKICSMDESIVGNIFTDVKCIKCGFEFALDIFWESMSHRKVYNDKINYNFFIKEDIEIFNCNELIIKKIIE